MTNKEYKLKAHNLIPGGAHTYSKGDDMFPPNAPSAIKKGKGARIWDLEDREFVDWGMGLTSVLLGHANSEMIEAIKQELENGVNFIRPSYLELELAEILNQQIPSAQMVKFAKNGSDATTAAVRLARAYTGKEIVLRCENQPFFSVHDWFIGDTAINSGTLKCVRDYTKKFKYNNLENFKEQVEKYKDNLACVILEVAATEEPQKEFLEGIREICTKENIVLIFDEVVSGFRFHPKGAQFLYGITPDLSTFGKAMANGYSISALVGKKEIMELGGLYHKKERVFLLSTTYGGETHHLRAAMKSIEILNRNNYEVTNYIWKVGKTIKEEFNKLSKQFNLYEKIRCEGVDCRPYFYCENGYLRLLFQQEMARYGVLVQSINPSFSHRDSEITQTIEAFEKSLKTLSYGIESNKIRELLIEDREIKPVFRKYN